MIVFRSVNTISNNLNIFQIMLLLRYVSGIRFESKGGDGPERRSGRRWRAVQAYYHRQLAMKSPTIGPREIGRLRQKCFSFGKTLLACRREFCFSLKVEDFEMSLGTVGTGDRRARPKCNRKRNPSYFRRQRRRREAFLQKRGLAGGSLVGGALGIGAETVESIQDGEGGGSLNLRK